MLQISGSASGVGLQESEFTVGEARVLLEGISDSYPSVEDWSFVLAFHGFDVPEIGMLRADGKNWTVFENGSIFERLP
jgi:hypothetical protein